jgi:type II secretory pathway component PulF
MMKHYRCLVSDSAGHASYQETSGMNEAEAARRLTGDGRILLSIEEIPERAEGGKAPSRNKTRSKKAVLEFTEMMELLLESGISLRDALEILTTINDKSQAAALGQQLLERINRGTSFAASVYAMHDTFPPIYRGMIKVGDKVGSVEQIFPRLSAYLKTQKTLREKTSAALAYPVLVLILAVVGSIGLIFYILPKLETIFGSFGGDSADQIRTNIGAIETGATVFAIIALGIITAVLVLRTLRAKNDKAAYTLDYYLLKIPALGKFLRSWESLNFTFAMEVLAGGGVPVEAALGEAAEVITNSAYRRALAHVREGIINGGNMSAAFAAEPLFPAHISRWAAIGERSGRSEKIFSQLRVFFQEEIEQRTTQFLLLIEPAMIILIGGLILALVVGIILPLFSVYGNVL